MMRRASLAAAAAVFALVASPAGATHAWANYHWARSANPATLTLVDSVTGVWDSLLPTVSADWTASSVLNTTITAGASGLIDTLLCQAISGKIRVCSANYGPNFWFGLATVYVGSSGHITQATTQVNDWYFTGSYANNTARRHVLCQEIGHDFGLTHQYTEPSCMDDTNSTLNTASFVDPGAHDYAQLESIYAHTDGALSASSSAAAPTGPSVFVSREGTSTVYTYILWAE